MKTRTILSIAVFSLLTLATNAAPADNNRTRTNEPSLMESLRGGRSALTKAVGSRGLLLKIEPTANNNYEVNIRSNIGLLRMKGQYMNSALTVPDGEFVYYHPNGRVECRGYYNKGVKTGTWVRYDLSGNELAAREYTGKNVEELQEAAGIFSVAREQ